MHVSESPLLRRVPAATLLTVSPRTLDRLVAQGRLPVVRLGGAVRFQRRDIEALIAQSRSVRDERGSP